MNRTSGAISASLREPDQAGIHITRHAARLDRRRRDAVGQPGCDHLPDRRRARPRRARLRRDGGQQLGEQAFGGAAWDQDFTDADLRLPDGTTFRDGGGGMFLPGGVTRDRAVIAHELAQGSPTSRPTCATASSRVL
jgi:hypothetical protein